MFIKNERGRKNKEIISTNFLKPHIENQNYESVWITTEMYKKTE